MSIKCPYCFKSFNHDQVLFRSATAFSQVDLDPMGRGETLEEIEFNMPDGPEKVSRINEYRRREKFLIKDDKVYNQFWEKFGSTSEVNSGIDEAVLDYKRPILYPNDKDLVPKGYQYDEDSFVYMVEDCFGHKSYDRVCPHCHNPLPPKYGKYPVKFISTIGISSSGKTVFLSKLIENIGDYLAKLGIVALPASNSSRKFVKDNKISLKTPLPGGNPPKYMSQPLFYNMTYDYNNVTQNQMVVIYDIAGENCVDAKNIFNYAEFVMNSDGLIVLLDPIQLMGGHDGDSVGLSDSILATLGNVFNTSMVKIPLALCISKSDLLRPHGILPDICFSDLRAVNGELFCASDYNIISNAIDNYIGSVEKQIKLVLEKKYRNFNYFAFTTLNCSTIADDSGRKFPERDPDPKRIEEPLFWLFTKLGFVKSEKPIVDHSKIAKEIMDLKKNISMHEAELQNIPIMRFSKRREIKDIIEELNRQLAEKRAERDS